MRKNKDIQCVTLSHQNKIILDKNCHLKVDTLKVTGNAFIDVLVGGGGGGGMTLATNKVTDPNPESFVVYNKTYLLDKHYVGKAVFRDNNNPTGSSSGSFFYDSLSFDPLLFESYGPHLVVVDQKVFPLFQLPNNYDNPCITGKYFKAQVEVIVAFQVQFKQIYTPTANVTLEVLKRNTTTSTEIVVSSKQLYLLDEGDEETIITLKSATILINDIVELLPGEEIAFRLVWSNLATTMDSEFYVVTNNNYASFNLIGLDSPFVGRVYLTNIQSIPSFAQIMDIDSDQFNPDFEITRASGFMLKLQQPLFKLSPLPFTGNVNMPLTWSAIVELSLTGLLQCYDSFPALSISFRISFVKNGTIIVSTSRHYYPVLEIKSSFTMTDSVVLSPDDTIGLQIESYDVNGNPSKNLYITQLFFTYQILSIVSPP
jgi:hypothetical protein